MLSDISRSIAPRSRSQWEVKIRSFSAIAFTSCLGCNISMMERFQINFALVITIGRQHATNETRAPPKKISTVFAWKWCLEIKGPRYQLKMSIYQVISVLIVTCLPKLVRHIGWWYFRYFSAHKAVISVSMLWIKW